MKTKRKIKYLRNMKLSQLIYFYMSLLISIFALFSHPCLTKQPSRSTLYKHTFPKGMEGAVNSILCPFLVSLTD